MYRQHLQFKPRLLRKSVLEQEDAMPGGVKQRTEWARDQGSLCARDLLELEPAPARVREAGGPGVGLAVKVRRGEDLDTQGPGVSLSALLLLTLTLLLRGTVPPTHWSAYLIGPTTNCHVYFFLSFFWEPSCEGCVQKEDTNINFVFPGIQTGFALCSECERWWRVPPPLITGKKIHVSQPKGCKGLGCPSTWGMEPNLPLSYPPSSKWFSLPAHHRKRMPWDQWPQLQSPEAAGMRVSHGVMVGTIRREITFSWICSASTEQFFKFFRR